MNTDKPAHYHKLGTEFVSIMAIVLIIILLANAFYQYNNEKELAKQALTIRGNSIGELLAEISVDSLLVYDNLTLTEYARNTSAQQDVIFTVYYNNDGKFITQFIDKSIPIVQQAIKISGNEDAKALVRTMTAMDSIAVSNFPVFFEKKELATIQIGLDTTSIEKMSLSHLYNQIMISITFALCVGIALYAGFVYKVTKPVKKLIIAVKDVANFEFDKEVKQNGNNEITYLADTINDMRLSLKKAVSERKSAFDELEQLNVNLEERVKHRTMELQSLNTEIAHQAMHDPLTDLPNRILVIERLKQAIKMAQRNNKRLAVFIIDLNNFKEINDTLGHPEGDIILQQVASRLPEALRSSDTIGRLGGDEFAVVLPDIDQDEAYQVAQKLHELFRPSFSLHNQPIAIGASIGIAIYPDHGEEQAVLIRRADVAMYEAKRNDEGVMLYDHEFDQYTPKRLALMADLRHAIDNNELELYYQPQIMASTGKVSCVEALLRWNHPKHGMISPEQFIYMAENSGLINTLFDWVLNQALIDWQEWHDAGITIEVSVNLSVRNLLDPNLAERISEIQSKHRVPNYCLKLEITESAVMSNPEKVLQMMADPVLSNLRYSIDDFGTGYSSLSYLKRLTVHEVKIDKSFVIDMHNNEEDASIVHSVIDLAHNLGHSVVAEGVESSDALDILQILGCDYLQGFLFAKPVPNSEILDVIKRINSYEDIIDIDQEY